MVNVENVEYRKLKDSYQEVFDSVAYKTKGKDYIKQNLEIDQKTGKIVRKINITVKNYTKKVDDSEPWTSY